MVLMGKLSIWTESAFSVKLGQCHLERRGAETVV